MPQPHPFSPSPDAHWNNFPVVSLRGGVEFLENKRNVATVITSSKTADLTHRRSEQNTDSDLSWVDTFCLSFTVGSSKVDESAQMNMHPNFPLSCYISALCAKLRNICTALGKAESSGDLTASCPLCPQLHWQCPSTLPRSALRFPWLPVATPSWPESGPAPSECLWPNLQVSVWQVDS